MKYKNYDAFFADVEAEGRFECPEYSDDVKLDIIADFRRVFRKEPNDPLTPYVGDILKTAKLREVRIFPENELMYVRAEVRFPKADGEYGEPCQVLALWDCFNVLKSYTFVRGEEMESIIPDELKVAYGEG